MKKWNYIRFVFTGSPFVFFSFFLLLFFVFIFISLSLSRCLCCLCRSVSTLTAMIGLGYCWCVPAVSHTRKHRTYEDCWRMRHRMRLTRNAQRVLSLVARQSESERGRERNTFACMVRRVHNNKINSSRRSCIYIFYIHYNSRDSCRPTLVVSPDRKRALVCVK